MNLYFVAAALFVSTLIGIAGGSFFKALSHRASDLLLAISAGMMLGASVVGLILPALSATTSYALLLSCIGVFAGAAVASLIDLVVPHLHRLAGLEGTIESRTRSALLFVATIALHKFPEGMAAGVSLGAENSESAITVVGSLALQNIPEAFVIVAPLLSAGTTRARTFIISIVIGLVSLLGLFIGNALIGITTILSPFLLTFAGGAMMYVVSNEMIPETHHDNSRAATFAIIFGFMSIIILSRLL